MEAGDWVIGVREGVIALIALVVLYIIVVALRMVRLRRQPAKTPLPAAIEPVLAMPATMPPPPPAMPGGSEPRPNDADLRQEQAIRAATEEFERRRLEQEVLQLRDEVDALRGELAALRQDMQQDLAHLHAAQAASPIYGDAVQMAAAGYDPAMIAERCGIARAEAELVVALAKNQER
jgi:hypothetical protein